MKPLQLFQLPALLLVLASPALAHQATGANAGENETDAATPKNAALAPVKDIPGLPRVLLIGDSISIGYTLQVRELLEGKANVHRTPFNCGPSHNGLIGTRGKWLGDGQWDVIHFNFGIWDAKIKPATGKVSTSDKTYVKNLSIIADQLKKTGAILIFATTTPIPDTLLVAKEPGHPLPPDTRVFVDVAPRNQLATTALQSKGVLIDDLHAAIYPEREKHWRSGDLHFTREGSTILAKAVAQSMEAALATRSVRH
ncbi:MAG: SGNH/GDSL hydrolase family protein [Opitutaceae bacterium]|jgi:acyl-CoA thioesterase-1|nr:SGNH/GDSL hydrolase family protein [Opitutaceae bacterium]